MLKIKGCLCPSAWPQKKKTTCWNLWAVGRCIRRQHWNATELKTGSRNCYWNAGNSVSTEPREGKQSYMLNLNHSSSSYKTHGRKLKNPNKNLYNMLWIQNEQRTQFLDLNMLCSWKGKGNLLCSPNTKSRVHARPRKQGKIKTENPKQLLPQVSSTYNAFLDLQPEGEGC